LAAVGAVYIVKTGDAMEKIGRFRVLFIVALFSMPPPYDCNSVDRADIVRDACP
jgi:hypothetical protein